MSDLNMKGLNDLISVLKKQNKKVRVGILGRSNSRSGLGGSNAGVGAVHEFGLGDHLQRSFLRVPVAENLNSYLEKSKAFTPEVCVEVLKEKTLVPWLEKVAIVAKRVVLDAFQSEGFGKWAPWKNPKYENNTGQILQNTTQLRKSIEWDVA